MKNFKIRTYGDKALTEAILKKMRELGDVNACDIPTSITAHLYKTGNRITFTSSEDDAFYCKDPHPEITINELFEMRALPELPALAVRGSMSRHPKWDAERKVFEIKVYETTLRICPLQLEGMRQFFEQCGGDIFTIDYKNHITFTASAVTQMLDYVDAVLPSK